MTGTLQENGPTGEGPAGASSARPPSAAARRPRPFGFPREARLLRPVDFRRVQGGGRTVDLGALVVRAAPRPEGGSDRGARLGLSVSRRVGGSVVRNRVRRLVREWFRHHRAALAGLDIVVSGRPAAAVLDRRAIDRILDTLPGRLGRGAEGGA